MVPNRLRTRRRTRQLPGLALAAVLGASSFTVEQDARASAAAANAGTLTVQIINVTSADGHVLLSIFAGADGFPSTHRKAVKTAKLRARAGTVRMSASDLPPGQYAVAVVHDENDNAKLDTNLFGIPREGWGTSRNPRPKTRAPRWSESSFAVEAGQTVTQRIQLVYP